MGSRLVKRWLSVLLVLSLLLSMSVTAFAVDSMTSVTPVDSTQGKAIVEFPDEWVSGRNTFDVICPVPCVGFVAHEDGSSERLYCAVVDKTTGHYRFQVNVSDGDTVGVAVKGDADSNGYVSVVDMTCISQYLAGLYQVNLSQKWASDADANGYVSVVDMTCISQYLAGLYQFSWDIGWEIDDEPDPVDPVDPNENATLALSVDKTSVHIGNAVQFSLSTNIQGDYELEYLLMVDGSTSALDVSGLDKTGGSLTLDETTGAYTMLATAVTTSGKTITSNPVAISVTNSAPVVTSVSAISTVPDNTTGYVPGAKIWVEVDAEVSDPDGDDYTLYYVSGDGYISGSSYYFEGDYKIGVYAVDKWGAKSDVFEYPYHVQYLDTEPAIYTDSDTVHIGELFDVHVNVDVLEDKVSVWRLYDAAGNEVEFNRSQLNKDGGKMCVEDGTGTYTLHAMGIDEYGVEFDMEQLTIGVTNNNPGVASVSHEIIPDDFEAAYTDDAKIYVKFETSGVDPNGDDVTVYMVDDNGDLVEPLVGGYYDEGTYTLKVCCVDEWGMKGAVTDYMFTVTNQAPNKPVVSATVSVTDVKYIGGQLNAYVEFSVTADDPDGNPVKLSFTEGEYESGYYPVGTYKTVVRSVDPWNAESADTVYSFTVGVDVPSLKVDGYENEVTVHIGDTFTVDTHAGDLDAYRVNYKLYDAAGNPVELDISDLTISGGTTSISTAVGDYTLKAIATIRPEPGVQTVLDEVLIHVENQAPTKPTVTATPDYDDTKIVDGKLCAYVHIVVSSADADGDEFTLVYENGLSSGYYPDGNYSFSVHGVDEWNGVGESTDCTFSVDTSAVRPYVSPASLTTHIGDDFDVNVYTGTLQTYGVRYMLTDPEGNETEVTGLESDGGTMKVTTGVGLYKLTAYLRLFGVGLYDIGSVDITVTNDAPVVSVTDFKQVHFADSKMTVAFDVTASDPNGDGYTVYYKVDDGEPVEKTDASIVIAVPVGSHTLTVYAVDEWGMVGESDVYSFEAGGYLSEDTLPVVSYTVTNAFNDGYTTDATRYIAFNVDWMLNDVELALDESQVEIFYMVNGTRVTDLSGYYALGNYDVEVYAVDMLGTTTQKGSCTLTLTNTAPVVSLVCEDQIATESITDDETLLKIVRTANGTEVTDFNSLPAGDYDVILTVTDVWGEVSTAEARLIIASTAPVLSINGHDVTAHNTTDITGYVEFDFTATAYNPDEYELHYTVDGVAVDGLDGWFALGAHKVSVYAQHKLLPDVVSDTENYVFTLSNHAPDAPVITDVIDRTDSKNEYSANMAIKASFSATTSDPDGDPVTLYWLLDGETVSTVDGYYDKGMHYVEAYAVDIWGTKSEVSTVGFKVTNDAPVVQSAYHTVNTGRTSVNADGEQTVWVDFTSTVVDADGDAYRVSYTVDGEPIIGTGAYLTIGRHALMVEAVDTWNAHSDVFEYEFDFTNNAPSAPVIVYTVDTNSVVNPYTAQASAPASLSATSVDPDGDPVTIHWEANSLTATGNTWNTTVSTGETIVTAYAVDSYGNRSAASSVRISVANDKPVTKTTMTPDQTNNQSPYTENAKMYVTFATTVRDSDPCKVYYSVDGGAYTETLPSGYYGIGTYDVSVYAIDIWGNKSSTENVTLNLVNDAPEAPVLAYRENRADVVNPYTMAAKFDVQFTGESFDPNGDSYQVYYSVDGGDFTTDISGYWAIGSYKIQAYAVDFWGAKSGITTMSYMPRNNAPTVSDVDFGTITESMIQNPYTTSAYVDAPVSASVRDRDNDLYRLTCKVDGVDATGSSTVRLTSGSHELVVQAVDIFGATSSEVHAFVDLGVTAPEIRSVTIKETDTFSNGYTTAAKELVNISADVIDNEMDAFKVTYQVGGVTTDTPSDYYGLGTYAVKVSAIDIWGNRSTDYNTSFTLSNQKPDTPSISANVDWNDVISPYTPDAKVKVTVNEAVATDPDKDALKVFYSVDGGAYSEELTLASDYYAAGKHTVSVYTLDPWGEKSDVYDYVLDLGGDAPKLVLTSDSFGADGYTTSGKSAIFNAAVTSTLQYKMAWLDYYATGRPVTEVGRGLTATSQTIGSNSWSSGRHLLVVQLMDILGQATYESFFFITDTSSGAGNSVVISGSTASDTTISLVGENGAALAYISGINVDVPVISGHGSGNKDYLQIVGIAANGVETQIVKFNTDNAYCHVTSSNGSGSYKSSSDSGTFTFDPAKYVAMRITFFSPHADCMASGGASMTYNIGYAFIKDAAALDNMASLFG